MSKTLITNNYAVKIINRKIKFIGIHEKKAI